MLGTDTLTRALCLFNRILNKYTQFKNRISLLFYHTRLLGRFAPIFYFICEHVLFMYIVKQKLKKFRGFKKRHFVNFKNFQKSNFVRGTFLKIRSSIYLSCGHIYLSWGHIYLSWGHTRLQTHFWPDSFLFLYCLILYKE